MSEIFKIQHFFGCFHSAAKSHVFLHVFGSCAIWWKKVGMTRCPAVLNYDLSEDIFD